MIRALALLAVVAACPAATAQAGLVAAAGSPVFAAAPRPPLYAEPIAWRRSTAVGSHAAGRLAAGVRLPPAGMHFFTWDPVLRASPNRPSRRWGTDRLVRVALAVLADFASEHPSAPRIGVGDLSRPGGGDFGRRFGGIGHVSHENGLDVDVYYPRLDGLERPATHPRQVDLRLAQDLVDRFVAAGAVKVFVGPRTPLRGPPRVVQALVHHDNHLHVRLPRRR